MANPLSGVITRGKSTADDVRHKQPWVDHVVQAYKRYTDDAGDRLAAAVTFFGFLSFFPLVALALAVAGYVVVIDPHAKAQVVDALKSQLPGLVGKGGIDVDSIAGARAGAGLLGLVGLLFAGLGWVDALRQSLRTIWHHNVKAGNFVKKKIADVIVLVGLGAAILLSLAVTGLGTSATTWLLDLVGLSEGLVANALLKVIAVGLAIVADVVLFLFLLVRLPRIETPLRRVVKGALFAAVGFEILKIVGSLYISHTTHNPIYGTFAVVVGLLVWINLVSRFFLFAAAWTVTAPYDDDVPPSGTANPELAREAGVPERYADDRDDPDATLEDGAWTPLLPAVNGAEEEPAVRTVDPYPAAAESAAEPRRRRLRR